MLARMPRSPAPHAYQVHPWGPGLCLVTLHSARSFPRHWHDRFGIGLITAGGQRSASGRGPVEALAGDVITTNPGEVHDGHPLWGQARHWHMLYLDPSALPHWLGTPELNPSQLTLGHPVLRDEALRQQWLRLWPQLLGTDALARESALAHLLQAALGRLTPARHHDRPSARRTPTTALAQVRDRLADAPELTHPLTELAAQAGLSTYQLLRQFQQAYGLPPHAWLMQQRLACAQRHLQAGLPLAEVAAASGFADQSHLTRLYTRQHGHPPGAWRKGAAAGR